MLVNFEFREQKINKNNGSCRKLHNNDFQNEGLGKLMVSTKLSVSKRSLMECNQLYIKEVINNFKRN